MLGSLPLALPMLLVCCMLAVNCISEDEFDLILHMDDDLIRMNNEGLIYFLYGPRALTSALARQIYDHLRVAEVSRHSVQLQQCDAGCDHLCEGVDLNLLEHRSRKLQGLSLHGVERLSSYGALTALDVLHSVTDRSRTIRRAVVLLHWDTENTNVNKPVLLNRVQSLDSIGLLNCSDGMREKMDSDVNVDHCPSRSERPVSLQAALVQHWRRLREQNDCARWTVNSDALVGRIGRFLDLTDESSISLCKSLEASLNTQIGVEGKAGLIWTLADQFETVTGIPLFRLLATRSKSTPPDDSILLVVFAAMGAFLSVFFGGIYVVFLCDHSEAAELTENHPVTIDICSDHLPNTHAYSSEVMVDPHSEQTHRNSLNDSRDPGVRDSDGEDSVHADNPNHFQIGAQSEEIIEVVDSEAPESVGDACINGSGSEMRSYPSTRSQTMASAGAKQTVLLSRERGQKTTAQSPRRSAKDSSKTTKPKQKGAGHGKTRKNKKSR